MWAFSGVSYLCYFFFTVLGIGPKVLHTLGKHCVMEPCSLLTCVMIAPNALVVLDSHRAETSAAPPSHQVHGPRQSPIQSPVTGGLWLPSGEGKGWRVGSLLLSLGTLRVTSLNELVQTCSTSHHSCRSGTYSGIGSD